MLFKLLMDVGEVSLMVMLVFLLFVQYVNMPVLLIHCFDTYQGTGNSLLGLIYENYLLFLTKIIKVSHIL